MDDLSNLTSSIAEVVNTPYPVSLTKLDQILTRTNSSTLDTWTVLKACQIDPLVATLIPRTKYENHASSVLDSLFRSGTILIAALKHDSASFENICRYVLERLESNIITKSSALLLAALPPDVAAPKSYIKVIESMIQTQETEILPFIGSAQLCVLIQLQDSTVRFCMDKWKLLLRSDHHQHAVAAVHVAKKLASFDQTPAAPENTASSPIYCLALKEWIDKATSLFRQGPKLTSILDTMILVVLKACSEETVACLDSIIENVEKCQDVVCSVEGKVLQEWAAHNSSVISKLANKCLLKCMSFRLRAAVFRVLNSFCSDDIPELSLPAAGLLLSDLSSSSGNILTSSHSLDNLVDELVGCLVPAVDAKIEAGSSNDPYQDHLQRIIRFILDRCQPVSAVSVQGYQNLEQAISMIESLRLRICGRSAVLGLLSDMIVQAGIPEWWTLDMTTPGEPMNCSGLPACSHRMERRRQHLCTAVSFLLLQSASMSDRIIPSDLVHLLRMNLMKTHGYYSGYNCQYSSPSKPNTSNTGHVEVGVLGGDWRRAIREHLAEHNRMTCDVVEGLIFEVCKDLQYRCENVEQPLRTAQAENGNLTERLRNVEEHVRATQKESDRLSHELFEKSHEADQDVAQSERLGRELADMRQLYTNMSSEISALKEELKCAYREHANSLENQHLQAQEHAAETYRCHPAKVSELEEQLRAKTSAESSLESELAWLKEEMSRTQEEMVAAHRTAITHLEQQHRLECTSWQKQIDTLEQRLSSQGAELLQAKSDVSSEQTKAQDKSKELDEAREDLHMWQQDLENQKAKVGQMEAAAETAKADVEELSRQQEGYEADRLGLAARVKELEKSEAALRKQCLVYQTALEKAKEAEQRVLAIFQGNRRPGASIVASAATATPSRLLLTPTQRLPEYGFASEDDEDYPEVLKLK